MSETFTWDAPPLTLEDQRLVNAYVEAGRTLDDLPYTVEFDSLVNTLGSPSDLNTKHAVFSRLLHLRKAGRLPRLGRTVAETY